MEDWLKEAAKANPGGVVAAIFVVVIALGALVWLKDVIDALTKLKVWIVWAWVRAKQVWRAPAVLQQTQAQLTALQTRLTETAVQLKAAEVRADAAHELIRKMQELALAFYRGDASAKTQIDKQFREIRIEYQIHANFSATVLREYRIFATDQPLHAWNTGMGASEEADEVSSFEAIAFEVHSEGVGELVYFPLLNQPRNKQFVVGFYPRVERHEERKVVASYTWPGLLRQVNTSVGETFEHTFRSAGTIEKIEIVFSMDPMVKGNLIGILPKDAPGQLTRSENPLTQRKELIYYAGRFEAGETVTNIVVRFESA